jgi:hypothetical protein
VDVDPATGGVGLQPGEGPGRGSGMSELTVRGRVVAVAVLSTVVALGAPGCGAGRPAAQPATQRTTQPAAHPATASQPATQQATQPAAHPATAGQPAVGCLDRLRVGPGTGDAAAGHRSLVLVFTNTGTTTCRLRGYPGVAGLDRDGRQLVQARRTPSGYLGGLGSGPLPTVALAPGKTASALVEALAFDQRTGDACTPWAGLLVTAPDGTRSSPVRWTGDGCAELEIHPVVPGSTGRGR